MANSHASVANSISQCQLPLQWIPSSALRWSDVLDFTHVTYWLLISPDVVVSDRRHANWLFF
jgi:hypothetical protein